MYGSFHFEKHFDPTPSTNDTLDGNESVDFDGISALSIISDTDSVTSAKSNFFSTRSQSMGLVNNPGNRLHLVGESETLLTISTSNKFCDLFPISLMTPFLM